MPRKAGTQAGRWIGAGELDCCQGLARALRAPARSAVEGREEEWAISPELLDEPAGGRKDESFEEDIVKL